MSLHQFGYDADHGVIVCQRCATCLVSRKESWIIHLRAAPHRMIGEELRLIVDHLSTYTNKMCEDAQDLSYFGRADGQCEKFSILNLRCRGLHAWVEIDQSHLLP